MNFKLIKKNLSQQQLRNIHGELAAIRHHAIYQLVEENLLADESFRILLTLLSDCETKVEHRIEMPFEAVK